jgi:hypothetical protein
VLLQMFDALLSNKVPGLWMTAAYPSLKPLASWYKDLQMRMEFMHGWNKGGVPVSIALPYIFFTQGEHPPPRNQSTASPCDWFFPSPASPRSALAVPGSSKRVWAGVCSTALIRSCAFPRRFPHGSAAEARAQALDPD